MAERLGVAVVGTGTIANSHLRSLSQHAPADVVAVYDVIPEKAREALEVTRVMSGAYESARTGKAVTLG